MASTASVKVNVDLSETAARLRRAAAMLEGLDALDQAVALDEEAWRARAESAEAEVERLRPVLEAARDVLLWCPSEPVSRVTVGNPVDLAVLKDRVARYDREATSA